MEKNFSQIDSNIRCVQSQLRGSFTYVRNSKGSQTDPCGTEHNIMFTHRITYTWPEFPIL